MADTVAAAIADVFGKVNSSIPGDVAPQSVLTYDYAVAEGPRQPFVTVSSGGFTVTSYQVVVTVHVPGEVPYVDDLRATQRLLERIAELIDLGLARSATWFSGYDPGRIYFTMSCVVDVERDMW